MAAHPPLTFVRPSVRYRDSFIAAYEEFSGRGKNDWLYMGPGAFEGLIYNDFPAYVGALRARESIAPPHFVRDRTYWAVRNEVVLGRIGLRMELNEFLANYGGHVGYIVRPGARRQGVATAMLAFVLGTPESKAIGSLLVTCDADNIASERVILRNGGVYESTVFQEGKSTGKKRYWFHVA